MRKTRFSDVSTVFGFYLRRSDAITARGMLLSSAELLRESSESWEFKGIVSIFEFESNFSRIVPAFEAF